MQIFCSSCCCRSGVVMSSTDCSKQKSLKVKIIPKILRLPSVFRFQTPGAIQKLFRLISVSVFLLSWSQFSFKTPRSGLQTGSNLDRAVATQSSFPSVLPAVHIKSSCWQVVSKLSSLFIYSILIKNHVVSSPSGLNYPLSRI